MENTYTIARRGLLYITRVSDVQAQTDAVFAVAKRNTAYEEQLLSAIRSRTGKDDILPSLTASPKVEAPKETKKVETPVSVPEKPVSETPRPSIGGKEAPANAPTIKGFDAAPAPTAASPAPQQAKAVESEGSGTCTTELIIRNTMMM